VASARPRRCALILAALRVGKSEQTSGRYRTTHISVVDEAEVMAGLSNIEWTDATWNPISGCLMISPGCTNCYAMRMAARLQAMNHPAYRRVTRKSAGRSVWTGKLHLNKVALDIPLQWKKPRRVFVNSMSDLFQDAFLAISCAKFGQRWD
jgi:hypothetical protein